MGVHSMNHFIVFVHKAQIYATETTVCDTHGLGWENGTKHKKKVIKVFCFLCSGPLPGSTSTLVVEVVCIET